MRGSLSLFKTHSHFRHRLPFILGEFRCIRPACPWRGLGTAASPTRTARELEAAGRVASQRCGACGDAIQFRPCGAILHLRVLDERVQALCVGSHTHQVDRPRRLLESEMAHLTEVTERFPQLGTLELLVGSSSNPNARPTDGGSISQISPILTSPESARYYVERARQGLPRALEDVVERARLPPSLHHFLSLLQPASSLRPGIDSQIH